MAPTVRAPMGMALEEGREWKGCSTPSKKLQAIMTMTALKKRGRYAEIRRFWIRQRLDSTGRVGHESSKVYDRLSEKDDAIEIFCIQIMKKAPKKLAVVGISEMLVKRGVALLADVLTEYGTTWDIEWRTTFGEIVLKPQIFHHRGINNTLNFAKETFENIRPNMDERVVTLCNKYNSIDPASKMNVRVSLSVEKYWQRVSVDVTQFGRNKLLTIVD
ncbi:unnamed protein product [Lepeophtheirus salmonis]|uniref:(salmon louse) hypothetical protein n=1 Tax=Lepeophtheirus salmonis TaxID=72036 RepID=A0A7R8CY56_LEPSM|nr:unnamed protein product [Lepeophtheirus salmonis]CAF2967304.1 unnamed protein product [Lepeophtheirus salmonis]